jgi:hypothetical protein
MSEREQGLILDLLQSKLSEEEFRRDFPLAYGAEGTASLGILQRAFREHDPIAVEFGLYLAHRFGVSQQHLEVLLALADVEWHERHEDVVDLLKKLKSPSSIAVLYRVAMKKYSYRAYDDTSSLSVKCIWVLGNIGNQEAIMYLGELLHCDNEILAQNADEQLTRIENRADTDVLREAARSARKTEK